MSPDADPLQRTEIIKIPTNVDLKLNKTYFETIKHCCIGLEVSDEIIFFQNILKSISRD